MRPKQTPDFLTVLNTQSHILRQIEGTESDLSEYYKTIVVDN